MVLLCSEIWQLSRSAFKEKRVDIHTKLMRRYKQVPEWWFICILIANIAITVFACEYYIEQLQLPWWGVLLACAIAFFFTLPIGIITATTNQVCFPTACISCHTTLQHQFTVFYSSLYADSGTEHHHRIHHGVLVSWTTRRKYVLQGVWLYQHEPSSNFSARF
jgi:hypothetical protein